jgi:hypothetical protein
MSQLPALSLLSYLYNGNNINAYFRGERCGLRKDGLRAKGKGVPKRLFGVFFAFTHSKK